MPALAGRLAGINAEVNLAVVDNELGASADATSRAN
jgi:hypothetical protein